MQDGYISLRAFARAHDCRLSAVQKAIKSGRVTDVLRNDRGFVVGIHAVNAWVEWQRNTDPSEAAKSGKVIAGAEASVVIHKTANVGTSESMPVVASNTVIPSATSSDPAQAATPPGAGVAGGEAVPPAGPGFLDHRTKREKFQADQAELEYLEKVGALVSVDQVDREVEELFTLVKSNVFRIIPKKSALLAAETDPGRIERLLTDALTQAFNESSHTLADDTAGGVEERAAAMS